MSRRLLQALLTEIEAVRACEGGRHPQSVTVGPSDHLTLATADYVKPNSDTLLGVPILLDNTLQPGEVHFVTASGAKIRLRNITVPENA